MTKLTKEREREAKFQSLLQASKDAQEALRHSIEDNEYVCPVVPWKIEMRKERLRVLLENIIRCEEMDRD